MGIEDDVSKIVRSKSIAHNRELIALFREYLIEEQIEPLPDNWAEALEYQFHMMAYSNSMIKNMTRAFLLGRVWEKHHEELEK